MEVKIKDLDKAIAKELEEYGDLIYTVTDTALNQAEKVLLRNLRASSPKLTGEYAKSWKSKGKKYKNRRFVGNAKMVKGKKGELPLSNIMEYGKKSSHKGEIGRTFDKSVDEMARVIVNEMKGKI